MGSYFFPVLWLVILILVTGIFAVNRTLARFRLTTAKNITTDIVPKLASLHQAYWLLWGIAGLLILGGIGFWHWEKTENKQEIRDKRNRLWPVFDKNKFWEAPDPYLAETEENAQLIAYGRDLIARTQDYFGVNGIVRPASINGMNCQNCHLDAGSKPFGNNYFAVESTYPQMRARSGTSETIAKRVNDCFQRSLNGQPLDTASHEMNAISAYIRWLGTAVPKGEKPRGTGLVEVPFLKRAADPVLGQKVYDEKCASCHGPDGQGLPMPGDSPRSYPPLWGDNSYNQGAGLFRLSRFAGYVKANMPFGATYQNPQISDEEAWDVAAFVNSRPRPKHPFLATDWPKIEKKSFDHPFGPYADTFPEVQHKFGPFEPIVAYYKAISNKK